MVANLIHQTHSSREVLDLDSTTATQAEATVDSDNELAIEHSTTVDSGSRQILDAQLVSNGKFIACLHKAKQEGELDSYSTASAQAHIDDEASPGSIYELYIQPAVKSDKSLYPASYVTIPLTRDCDSIVWSHGRTGTQPDATVIGAMYSSTATSSVGVTIVRLQYEPTQKLRLPDVTPAVGDELV